MQKEWIKKQWNMTFCSTRSLITLTSGFHESFPVSEMLSEKGRVSLQSEVAVFLISLLLLIILKFFPDFSGWRASNKEEGRKESLFALHSCAYSHSA